jgi:Xaa-Pro aminopeptidase
MQVLPGEGSGGGHQVPRLHQRHLTVRPQMRVRADRIARVQAGMREQGLVAIVVMNHDDYRYLFGEDRAQPRALIPVSGPPELVAFTGEEPELRSALDEGEIRVFGSVGGQIHEIVGRLRELAAAGIAAGMAPAGGRPKVGMQMWFHTPAFLVDMFRQINPEIELVSSDPVMDPLRTIKDAGELALMTEAQRIAGVGMDRAREMLRPGVKAAEVATEVTYAMMRAGAEATSTPIYVNFGVETCMLHGRLSPAPLEPGQLALIDLTPQVEGYCANLARTFVLGKPDQRQHELLTTYRDMAAAARGAMKPGVTISGLDEAAKEVAARNGLSEYQTYGIGHGIGLRFEEPPAPTIIPPHRSLPLREGMTVTIGHTILAIPGFGGVRFEDVYRVEAGGPRVLFEYPIDPVLAV